jgi:hypothetical protein
VGARVVPLLLIGRRSLFAALGAPGSGRRGPPAEARVERPCSSRVIELHVRNDGPTR